jgi:hypothetical protein
MMKNINQSKHLRDIPEVTAHNQYSVWQTPTHYMCGQAVQEETLLEKIAVSAAFLFCVTLIIFMG